MSAVGHPGDAEDFYDNILVLGDFKISEDSSLNTFQGELRKNPRRWYQQGHPGYQVTSRYFLTSDSYSAPPKTPE